LCRMREREREREREKGPTTLRCWEEGEKQIKEMKPENSMH